MKCSLLILVLSSMAVIGCSPHKPDPSGNQAINARATDRGATGELQTLDRLRQFAADARQGPHNDDWWLLKLRDVNVQTTDDQLPTVEQFAVTQEGSSIVFILARLLVERGRLNGAANVIVTSLDGESTDDPRSAVWKWWEFNFHDRADFDDLTRRMSEAFYHQFLLGTSSRRRIIAVVFGLSPDDALLNPDEFHKKAFKDAQ